MRTSLIALSLVLAACGGGELGDGPTTTVPPEDVTTTTVAEAGSVSAYFLHDSGGNKVRFGPFLAPVSRPHTGVIEAVEALLSGPTAEESAAGYSTAIPDGTSLRGISANGSVATIDLTGEFDDGGGTFSMAARLAQLTFTVTSADPSFTGVLVALDGEPVTVFSSEGILIEEPMTRTGFDDILPGILVDSPARGEQVEESLVISGVAAAFEGVFQLEILDASGAVVATVPFVQTDNGVGWGSFEVSFTETDLPVEAELTIRVYELSAEDGSVVSERLVPFSWRR